MQASRAPHASPETSSIRACCWPLHRRPNVDAACAAVEAWGRAPAGSQGRRRAGLRDTRLSRSFHHRRRGGLTKRAKTRTTSLGPNRSPSRPSPWPTYWSASWSCRSAGVIQRGFAAFQSLTSVPASWKTMGPRPSTTSVRIALSRPATIGTVRGARRPAPGHGTSSGVRGAGRARTRAQSISSAGRTPWWTTSCASPSIISDWIACVDAARRGELKSETEGDNRGEQSRPESIAC